MAVLTDEREELEAAKDAADETLVEATPKRVYNNDHLLERLAAEDPKAMTDLYDRYGGMVWSMARRWVGTQADAEDATQEIFLSIWKNAGHYNPQLSSEATFIIMIARRRLIDLHRRKMAEREATAARAAEYEPVETHEPYEMSEDTLAALKMFSKLSDEQECVLRLAYRNGLSYRMIARQTGLRLDMVKACARRGLRKLNQMLAQRQHQPQA